MRYSVIAALLSVSAASSSAESIELLAEHRWKHRLLIAFAADEADLHLDSLRTATTAAGCELEDRDMLIGWILSEANSRVGEHPISDETATLLRNRLGIQPGEFAVLLIGKDGGIKARYNSVPALSRIFALVDGMPMRRTEMRARPSVCAE